MLHRINTSHITLASHPSTTMQAKQVYVIKLESSFYVSDAGMRGQGARCHQLELGRSPAAQTSFRHRPMLCY